MLLSAAGKHPDAPLLYSFLGRVFFLDHNYLNTVIAMKKAEALQPLEEKDRFTLAMAYVILHRPDWVRPDAPENDEHSRRKLQIFESLKSKDLRLVLSDLDATGLPSS